MEVGLSWPEAISSTPPNMALQRTRRPRIRSGRSLCSLGSPLNAYPLGGFRQIALRLSRFAPRAPGLVLSMVLSASQVAAEVRIDVSAGWSGLRPEIIGAERRERHTLTITCDEAECRSVDGVFPRATVENFLRELIAKPKIGPELQDLGLTGKELLQTVRLAKEYPASSEHPEQRRDAVGRFLLGRANLERLVGAHFDPHTTSTDDYPNVTGKASWSGQSVEFSSHSYRFFMLPWKVTGRDRSFARYNAEISRTLARLLPPDFVNLHRLGDDWFRRWLVDQAWSAVNAEAQRSK